MQQKLDDFKAEMFTWIRCLIAQQNNPSLDVLLPGSCKKLMSYNWFHVQEHLRYLWIQCDLTNTAEKFLEKLYLLKSLRVLRLDEMKGFTEGVFFQILAVLPALEVNFNQ